MIAPQLALGSVQFGLAYGIAGRGSPVPGHEVATILARAARLRIPIIDTAPGYGDIEERLAQLAGSEPFAFVSKIPAIPSGLMPSAVRQFVKQSAALTIERLGTRLRTILFHRGADLLESHGREAWEGALEATRGAGVTLGVSCYSPDEVAGIRAQFPVAVVQIPGNVFDQRLRAATGLEGLEIYLRSAFLQGLLLMSADDGARRLPPAGPALTRWESWCRIRGISKLEAALGVVKTLPGVSYCLVGVDRLEQFDEIAIAWNRAIPIEARELAVTDEQVIDPRRWS